jgi:hypothetical protein
MCSLTIIGVSYVLVLILHKKSPDAVPLRKTIFLVSQDASEMKVMLGAHNVRETTEEGRIEVSNNMYRIVKR